ncbi:MAG: GntR family transcriptional regulator, partial [Thomasclavelia ramosa]|nr:GntR family transcriptional regulator [Thomasclavelia ramosa]
MKQKQTLFNYLYNNLHDLIVSGRLPYGSKLPSISELCEFYN